MKKISEVISKKMFINAFKICKSYTKKDYITDINLLILKNAFNSITEHNVSTYYDKYVKSELFYAVPYLFTTDIVNIPKNINGLREYRFFTMMSMVLYNAIGLLFVEICSTFYNDLQFNSQRIYQFSPTVFNQNSEKDSEWTAKNNYSSQYSKYKNKMQDIIEKGDIILKIDISNYFNSMEHKKLINLLKEVGLESKLARYDIDEKAMETLSFYFESLMNKKQGIPQGKLNCISDLYGLLYLLPLDLNIVNICNNNKLKFKAMIRYVDDSIIIFKNENNISNNLVFKELSKIEQKISLFLNNELSLNINNKKTQYSIIRNEEEKKVFFEKNSKQVSNAKKIKTNGNC